MADFGTLPPGGSPSVQPITLHIAEEKLQLMTDLLKLSPIAISTFENSRSGQYYGIERSWVMDAKEAWLNDFSWRKTEERLNSFPNFKALTTDEAHNDVEVHFMALFSKRSNAIPLVFLHGWPGSILEFLDILDLLRHKYTPENLPYHVIVPSLPGYAFSGGPPLESDYSVELAASAIHDLMMQLGFATYLVQGGDLGSFISRVLALKYETCLGMHLNMMPFPPDDKLVEVDAELMQKISDRGKDIMDTDYAFVLEQGTKTSTIGIAMSSSPLALLATLGEKYLAWSDEQPSFEKILEAVSLYWLTDTFPRSLYHHRAMGDPKETPKRAKTSVALTGSALRMLYVQKPCGYSLFEKEILPMPEQLARLSCNLVFFNKHPHGGHFAAMERPRELLADVENYVKAVVGDSRS